MKKPQKLYMVNKNPITINLENLYYILIRIKLQFEIVIIKEYFLLCLVLDFKYFITFSKV